jgi:hypothetical protein
MTETNPKAERAAFFTAGQAVSAWREGLTLKCISFLPEGDEIWLDIDEPAFPSGELWRANDCKNAKSVIRALLTGPAAQERYSFGGCSDDVASGHDAFSADRIVWRAVDLAGQMPERGPVLPQRWREVRSFVESEEGWAAICVIAQMLRECGELSGSEVSDFARHAMCRTG